MSELLASIKGLFSLHYNKVYIDNVVFRLHYKVTAVLLLLFGILVTSRQYIGDPIDCITDAKAERLVDQFCWVHGTYTQLLITKKNVGYEKAPTLEDDEKYLQLKKLQSEGKSNPYLEREYFNYKAGDVKNRRFHSWYQWVWCTLFFQAFLFYLPHWLWKTWEAGRMKTFVGALNEYNVSKEDKASHEEAVVDYFCHEGHGRWNIFCWRPNGNHTGYTLKYFFCEILNFVNICSQLLILDYYFDYELSTNGFSLWSTSDSRPYTRHDFFTKIFPIITMCEIPIIGFGGSIVGHQALCVLPVNILNEKIFIFLWCWFIFVLTITSIGLCYRILTLFPSTWIRKMLLLRLNHSMPENMVEAICSRVDVGDWYFLYLLGKNMNPIYYADLLRNLANRFVGNTPGNHWNHEEGSFKKQPHVA